MFDNVIVGCGSGLSADQRGYDWRPDAGPNNTPGDSWNLLEKLQNVGYQSEPWASRYPDCAAIPNDWNVIIAADATWLFPEGCVFDRNVGYRNATWTRGEAALTHYASISGNLEDTDPLFADEANLNLALREDSPALGIPGFVPIPFDEVGIQPRGWRGKWPRFGVPEWALASRAQCARHFGSAWLAAHSDLRARPGDDGHLLGERWGASPGAHRVSWSAAGFDRQAL